MNDRALNTELSQGGHGCRQTFPGGVRWKVLSLLSSTSRELHYDRLTHAHPLDRFRSWWDQNDGRRF